MAAAAHHLGRRLGLLLLLLVLRVGLHLLPLLRRELGHHRALGGAAEEVEVGRPLEAVVGGAQVGGGDDEVEVKRIARVEAEGRGRPLRPRRGRPHPPWPALLPRPRRARSRPPRALAARPSCASSCFGTAPAPPPRGAKRPPAPRARGSLALLSAPMQTPTGFSSLRQSNSRNLVACCPQRCEAERRGVRHPLPR